MLQFRQMPDVMPFESVKLLFDNCLKDINKQCQQLRVPWTVIDCQWSAEDEGDKRVLSNVISLLKKCDHHWAKFERFKNLYGQT